MTNAHFSYVFDQLPDEPRPVPVVELALALAELERVVDGEVGGQLVHKVDEEALEVDLLRLGIALHVQHRGVLILKSFFIN